MQRAWHSAIGLPSRATNALWMLAFLVPAEVSKNFMIPPSNVTPGARRAPTQVRKLTDAARPQGRLHYRPARCRSALDILMRPPLWRPELEICAQEAGSSG